MVSQRFDGEMDGLPILLGGKLTLVARFEVRIMNYAIVVVGRRGWNHLEA